MQGSKWDLSRLSAGERSALKRSAGTMMDSAGMLAVEAFYRAQTTSCSLYAEKAWFAALCMQCLWREDDHPQVKPLQELLREVYQDLDATESMRRNCVSFLELPWSDDGFLLGKICSWVKKLRAAHPETMPDFNLLAADLAQWNHADRFVQRRWLNTICRTIQDSAERDQSLSNEEEMKNVD